MNDAYSLLNLSRDVIKDFHLLANRIDDIQIQRIINNNVRKLKSIEEQMLANGGLNVSKQSIDEVLYKVVKASVRDELVLDEWTGRELRILSYYMMKLQDEEAAFEYGLKLLDIGWKNLFFNGLLFFLLNSWCLIKPTLRAKVSGLVIKKLQNYEDNNPRFKILKNNGNLLEESGPIRLAAILIAKNMDINKAPEIIGSKPSAISQSYFSDVIIKYCNRFKLNEEKLEKLFSVHNLQRTKQLVFADLVQHEDEAGNPISQALLSNFINRSLGDVTLKQTWAPFLGATYEEAQRLKDAMQRVNLWFTRRIIETFFEVCVQDRDRKNFWLDYVPHVKGFKIAGSSTTKQLIQSDPKIGSMFHRHFIETNSRISQTSALILNIREYILIEFSDTGSLYAYKQDNKSISFLKRVNKNSVSISDLKQPSLGMLVEQGYWGYNTYREEGRMVHMGYWQERLKAWMDYNVMSEDNISPSFFDPIDDKTFSARPLPKQEKITSVTSSDVKPKVRAINNPVKVKESIEKKDNSQHPKQVTLKTSIVSQPEVEATLRLSNQLFTEAIYKSNVDYSKTSKYFFYDSVRVVCNKESFFINIYKTKKFVKIRNIIGELPSGNIWIKGQNADGWSSIVFALPSKKEIIVGYIRLGGGSVIFKQDLDISSYMIIKIR